MLKCFNGDAEIHDTVIPHDTKQIFENSSQLTISLPEKRSSVIFEYKII